MAPLPATNTYGPCTTPAMALIQYTYNFSSLYRIMAIPPRSPHSPSPYPRSSIGGSPPPPPPPKFWARAGRSPPLHLRVQTLCGEDKWPLDSPLCESPLDRTPAPFYLLFNLHKIELKCREWIHLRCSFQKVSCAMIFHNNILDFNENSVGFNAE